MEVNTTLSKRRSQNPPCSRARPPAPADKARSPHSPRAWHRGSTPPTPWSRNRAACHHPLPRDPSLGGLGLLHLAAGMAQASAPPAPDEAPPPVPRIRRPPVPPNPAELLDCERCGGTIFFCIENLWTMCCADTECHERVRMPASVLIRHHLGLE